MREAWEQSQHNIAQDLCVLTLSRVALHELTNAFVTAGTKQVQDALKGGKGGGVYFPLIAAQVPASSFQASSVSFIALFRAMACCMEGLILCSSFSKTLYITTNSATVCCTCVRAYTEVGWAKRRD